MVRAFATTALVALIASGLMLATVAEGATKRAVPQGWVGVNDDPWDRSLTGVDFYRGANNELDRMVASGIEAVRFPIYWFRIQPYRSIDSCLADPTPSVDCSQLTLDPADRSAAPYNWSSLDSWVVAAAARRIKLMPTLLGAPLWAASSVYPPRSSYNPLSKLEMPIPADNSQFARFAAVLAQRYGTNGSLWLAKPEAFKKPITQWQIWNEPDRREDWPRHLADCVPELAQRSSPSRCPAVSFKVRPSDRKATRFDLPNQTDAQMDALSSDPLVWPGIRKALAAKKLTQLGWAPSFIQLLKSTRAAIKAADPKAAVIMPGLMSSTAPELGRVYRAGGRGLFDAVSANIFLPATKAVAAAMAFRRTASAYGDRSMPIYVAEFAWASGPDLVAPNQSMSSIVNDRKGQASQLAASLRAFAGPGYPDKISGVFWYRWVSGDRNTEDVWDWTGLNSYDGTAGTLPTPKPALGAFRATALKLEGCLGKLTATTCRK